MEEGETVEEAARREVGPRNIQPCCFLFVVDALVPQGMAGAAHTRVWARATLPHYVMYAWHAPQLQEEAGITATDIAPLGRLFFVFDTDVDTPWEVHGALRSLRGCRACLPATCAHATPHQQHRPVSGSVLRARV